MSKSILIIGGGVIGLCTAFYARQRGHRVTVVERGAPDHDCCSLGNAGIVVPSHFVPLAAPGMVETGLRMMFNPESPFYVRPRLDADLLRWGWLFCRAANVKHLQRAAPLLCQLNLASRQLYEEFADITNNDFGLEKNGSLMLCKTEHGLHEEADTAKTARELGLQAAVLSPEEAARLQHDVRMDIAGAVYYPQDCYLTPQRFMATLARLAEENSVEFAWSTEVVGWRASNGRIAAVRTNRGEMSADEYVVAGGAWSPQVVRDLGLKLPMQAGKGYNVTLPHPKKLPTLCSILTEARVAVTPMGSSLRFAGTMEIAGMNPSINPRRISGILKSVPKYLPEFGPDDFRDAPRWCGLRPCSPDGLPYVGRFAHFENLSVAAGHAMMGLSLGPITGKLMSEVLSDQTPSMDVSLLSPDRYG
jgi:D-amino-acid dehydrogenase